jgi:hypothetical protein
LRSHECERGTQEWSACATLFPGRGAAAQFVEEVEQKRQVRGRLCGIRIVGEKRRETLAVRKNFNGLDVAHASRADEREDLVVTEFVTYGKRHMSESA